MNSKFLEYYGLIFGTYHLFDERIISSAISMGYRAIDTAENYGNEEIVGNAIKNAKREKLFIISKVSPDHLDYNSVIKSAVNSVKKLDTYIDLYLIHIPNPKISLKETFLAMKKLQQKHIIRFFGVSNFDLFQTKKALKYGIIANENEFNLKFKYLKKLVYFCNKNNVLFLAYRPFFGGELLHSPFVEKIEPLAKKYHTFSPNIALKWIISHNAIPIIGSSNLDHLKQNQDLNFKITQNDLLFLDSLFS